MDEEMSYFTLPNGGDVGPPHSLAAQHFLNEAQFTAGEKGVQLQSSHWSAECWGKITKGFLRDESKCIEWLHRTLPLDPNKKGSVRNSFPVHGIARTQVIGVGIYFKSICLSCQTPTGSCKDKKKCFHFANLLLAILKVICCCYNLRSLLLPLYMWDKHV